MAAEKIIGRTVAQIIPTLVSGLYNDKYDIVREYCQNAYDAILKKYHDRAAEKGIIEIRTKGTTLTVNDNGTGMERAVVRRLAEIGYSTKDTADQVGYRGIGRLAGICGAKRIIFITKAAGETVEHCFSIDAGQLVASLDRESKFNEDAGEFLARFSSHSEKPVHTGESYTTVIMDEIYGEAGKLLRELELREYLELNLPIPISPHFVYEKKINTLYTQYEKTFPNLKIMLNDRVLYKPLNELPDGLQQDSMILKNSRGKTLSVAWYIWSPHTSGMVINDRLRGLRLRHRGFTIGGPRDMRAALQTAPMQAADWFVGEVIAVDDRLQVSSDRSRFEDSEARSELLITLRKELGKKLSQLAHEISRGVSKAKTVTHCLEISKALTRIAKGKTYISEQQKETKVKEAQRMIYKLEDVGKHAKNQRESKRAQHLASKVASLLNHINNQRSGKNELARMCRFSSQAKDVYYTVVKAIEKHYSVNGSAEELITEIEKDLLRKYGDART